MQRQITFIQLSLCVFVCGMAHADWLRTFPLPLSDGRYVDLDAEGRFLFIDYVAEEGVVLAQLDPQDARMIIGGFVLPEQRQAYLLYGDAKAEVHISVNRIGDFGGKRPVISELSDHAFRFNPSTCSGGDHPSERSDAGHGFMYQLLGFWSSFFVFCAWILL